MDERRRFGNACEVAAARFLEDKGYKILVHQFKTKFGEIDLIAEYNEEIIFIEVKARKNYNFGYPEEAIDRRKIRRMVLTGQIYLEKQKSPDRSFRLDAIAIVSSLSGKLEIKHFEGIDIEGLEC